MKYIIWIIVIVLVIWGLVSWSGNNDVTPAATEPIKIGVILPLSGPAAAFGERSKQAVDLALAGLTDDERSKIQVVYGDDQLDTKQTVTIAQKLIEVDKVSALVAWSSPSSVVASYVAEKNGIPMIGLGNSSEINTGKQWVIRYMLGPAPQAKAIVDMLLKGKYKNVAIMWNQSDGPKSVHDELIKILPADGFKIVADESVTKGENDFKTSITKLRAAKPDVIIIYISPQIGVFAKQAKDQKFDVPLVSGPPFEIVEQIKAAEGALDNQLFVGTDNLAFVNNFYTKYNTFPTIAGDYLFDAITQIARAVNQFGDSKQEIVKFLGQSFSGVAGQYTYNNDGSFDIAQVVKKWDGERFVLAGN